MGRKYLRKLVTSAGFAFLLQSPLFAQSTVPSEVGRQTELLQERAEREFQRKAEEFEAEQRVAPSGEKVIPPQVPEVAPGDCVEIRQVDIKGMTLFKHSDFEAELTALIGPCTGLDTINVLLRRITNHYIERGYVTSRAVVAPQDLNDGTLEIIVFEGKLSEIKPASDEAPAGSSALSMALPGLEERTLNLRDIEQGIDQITRLPSLDAKMDIEPGLRQATSNVVVNSSRQKFWLRPTITLDNDGQLSTGRHQLGLSLSADNVFGLLDSWNAYYSTEVSDRRGIGFESYGGFFSIPYGYWTLSLGGGRYEYVNRIEGNGQLFASDGVSWNASATLGRLLYRDSDTKLSASFGLRLNDTLNRIQGIRLSASSYRLVTGDVRFQLQQKIGPGLVQASVGVTRGFDILGANSADFGPDGPQLSFRKITGDVLYFQPLEIFGVKTRYSAQLRGQALIDPALPAQRFSLGGGGTVRGFRDDGISGGYGLFFRQQIGWDLFDFPIGQSGSPRAKFEMFAGYDAGGIFPREGDRFERGYIHSSVLGITMNSPYFGASAYAAVPLSAPSFVQHKDVELTLSMRFGF